jgi:hypothetical protein
MPSTASAAITVAGFAEPESAKANPGEPAVDFATRIVSDGSKPAEVFSS